jgi:hypothetical protein
LAIHYLHAAKVTCPVPEKTAKTLIFLGARPYNFVKHLIMKFILITTLLLLRPSCCVPQFTTRAGYLQYIGAGIYSRNFTDVFSFTNNQASLSQVKVPTVGVCSEKRFLLKELTAFSAALGLPVSAGAIGVSASYFGFAAYNLSAVGLAYGRAVGKSADLGVQFNYNRMSITGYGQAAALFFEVGAVFHLTEKLHAGCHLFNPAGLGKFETLGEKVPPAYTIGYGYEVSDKVLISGEIIKKDLQPVIFRLAFLYAFEKWFGMRGGLASADGQAFFGAGLTKKNTRLDFSASWHPQLGITPSILLIFALRADPETSE